MARSTRKLRPKGELKRELIEQLQLLRHSCLAFDSGLEAIGKHISLSLRVLLHNHGQSRALLDQLGLRSLRYLSSIPPLNPRNSFSECNLVIQQVKVVETNVSIAASYVPIVATGEPPPFQLQAITFVNWWNDPVLRDNRGRTLCRRELILNVADTDGGAHVDAELEEAYMAISRENSLGWTFTSGGIESVFNNRPELACMRQIAHELLSTLHKFSPEYSEHSSPVIVEQVK